MTYEMCRSVFVTAGILGGIVLAVTILLFFILKVPDLIRYFTGFAERKEVENICRQMEESDSRPPVCNTDVPEITDIPGKINSSGYLPEETVELSVSDEMTESGASGEAIPEETSLLTRPESSFQIEYEICYIHSNEMIG